MGINDLIFKEYDIRGLAEQDLPNDIVDKIIKAYYAYIARLRPSSKNKIIVGRDTRLSSQRIYDKVVSALVQCGADVVKIGICPTPVLYFAERKYLAHGAIMVTASHNPKDHNGFKMNFNGLSLYGKAIQKIKQIAKAESFLSHGVGLTVEMDANKDYLQFHSRPNSLAGLKVVLDAGNGVAGIVAPSAFSQMGAEVVSLYCIPDGNFPNHHPDPTIPENLKALIQRVKDVNADIGFAYDGDGDRLGAVTKTGRIVWGDELTAILGQDLLQRKPSCQIIFDVKCRSGVFKALRKLGGNVTMWKTGHSLIKTKMRETKASLAGEMSGHIFLGENYYGFDDAIYASIKIAEILKNKQKQEKGMHFEQLLHFLGESYITPEIRIECPDQNKQPCVEQFKQQLLSHQNDGKAPKINAFNDIDGIRVEFEHGWILLRASNTQPAIVVRAEGDTTANLEEYKTVLDQHLTKAFVALQMPSPKLIL